MQRQSDLLHVVFALCAASSLTGLLNCRQQQCNQNCNDGDHHQQFNQGKGTTLFSSHKTSPENEQLNKNDPMIIGTRIQLP
jgi:hypothetical protein